MLPTIKPNQEILVSSVPYFFTDPKVGDIVAFKLDGGKYIVKRIKTLKSGKYYVEGDNKQDSKSYELLSKKQIIGKVIYVHS